MVVNEAELFKIEQYLKDYESNEELISIVEKVFVTLSDQVDKRFLNDQMTDSMNNYQQLEKQL